MMNRIFFDFLETSDLLPGTGQVPNAAIQPGQFITGAGISGTVTVASIAGTLLELSSAQTIDDRAGLRFAVCDSANSVCQNTPGSSSCICVPGYEVGGGGTCVDIDECTGVVREETPIYYIRDTISGDHSLTAVTCFASGATAGTNTCLSPATCVNEVGSYHCECPNGFLALATSSSTECLDINECAHRTANSCARRSTSCINSV